MHSRNHTEERGRERSVHGSAPYPTPSSLGHFGCFPVAISTASDFGIVVLHLIEVNNLFSSSSSSSRDSSPYRARKGGQTRRGGHCTLQHSTRSALSLHRRVASAASHAHGPRPALRGLSRACVRSRELRALPTANFPLLTVNQTTRRLRCSKSLHRFVLSDN